MTSTDNNPQNETEATTLPIQEMTAEEAQDADLPLPGFLLRTASPATQDLHQESTLTSTPLSSPTPQESSMPGTFDETTRKRSAKTIQIAGNVLLVKDLTFADGDGKRIHWKEMANKKGITHATAYGRITSQNWDHESDLIEALSMPTRGKGQPQESEHNAGAIHTESPEPQHHQSEVQAAATSTDGNMATQLSKIEKAVQAARIVNGLDLDPDIREQLFVTALKAAMATMQKVLDSIEG